MRNAIREDLLLIINLKMTNEKHTHLNNSRGEEGWKPMKEPVFCSKLKKYIAFSFKKRM